MKGSQHYGAQLAWSTEDGEYIATSAAWPGLSGCDADPVAAVKTLYEAIEMAIEANTEDGDSLPTAHPTVFAVTVIADVNRARCWGVAPTFEKAESAVLRNVTDLAEREYGYAVIEEVYFGIPSLVVHGREWWYQWEGNWKDGAYRRIPKPDEFERIVGWGIG